MPEEYWVAIFLAACSILMWIPRKIDKMRRKAHSQKTTKPDPLFDKITEFRNDIA